MKTESQATRSVSDDTPYGKVMGVVENREQLQAVSAEFSKLGIVDVNVLGGNKGVNELDHEKDAVSHFFLGDMESKMVQSYLDAVKNGQIVFAAVVSPEDAQRSRRGCQSHKGHP